MGRIKSFINKHKEEFILVGAMAVGVTAVYLNRNYVVEKRKPEQSKITWNVKPLVTREVVDDFMNLNDGINGTEYAIVHETIGGEGYQIVPLNRVR